MASQRTQLKLLSLGIICVMILVPASAFADEEIVVSPLNPTELDTLEITITAVCCYITVDILDTTVVVSEGLISIIADRDCGPWTMPGPYTHTVVVPPVEPGLYSIEYWVTGTCPSGEFPEVTGEVLVSPAPVPALEEIGILVLLVALAALGTAIVRKASFAVQITS